MIFDTLFPTTAEFEFEHPVHGKQGFFLECQGLDSMPVSRKFTALRMAHFSKASEDAIAERELEVAVAAIVGWRGVQDKDGNEVPFSQEKACEYLTQSAPLYKAVDSFIMDRQQFFR